MCKSYFRVLQGTRKLPKCIFSLFGCENWHCAIGAFEIRTVLDNIEAKKKKGGYI